MSPSQFNAAARRTLFSPLLRRTAVTSPSSFRRHQRSFWSHSAPGAATAAAATASSTGEGLPFDALPAIADSFLPVILALLLAQADDDDSRDTGLDNSQQNPPWLVKYTTAKDGTNTGMGAFATTDIKPGTRLIAERPLCIWPQSLSLQHAQQLFDAMPAESQKAYSDLSRSDGVRDNQDGNMVRAVRATNGFAVQLPAVASTGDNATGSSFTAPMVFHRIARINHSCTPNCSQAMNPKTLRMEIYALTSIPAGSEITIDYIPLITSTRSERHALLRRRFGFDTCLCSVCESSPAQVRASDERRKELRRLSEGLSNRRVGGGGGGQRDRQAVKDKLERIRVLLDEEGYVGMPEFEDVNVSNAYVAYASMHRRAERERLQAQQQ